jgi:hypothetical protein
VAREGGVGQVVSGYGGCGNAQLVGRCSFPQGAEEPGKVAFRRSPPPPSPSLLRFPELAVIFQRCPGLSR